MLKIGLVEPFCCFSICVGYSSRFLFVGLYLLYIVDSKKKKNLSSLKSVTWFLSLLVTKVGTGNCSILSLSDQILMELYGKNQINNVKILDWLKSWIVYRNFSLFYRLLAVGIKFVSKSTTVRLLSEWCNIVEYGVSCGSLENVCFCKRHHHFSLKL